MVLDNALQAELRSMHERLREIETSLVRSVGCELSVRVTEVHNKPEVVVAGDPAGLVHVALWALECAAGDVEGKHAHIDEFGMADSGSTPMVITRARSQAGGPA